MGLELSFTHLSPQPLREQRKLAGLSTVPRAATHSSERHQFDGGVTGSWRHQVLIRSVRNAPFIMTHSFARRPQSLPSVLLHLHLDSDLLEEQESAVLGYMMG